MVSFNDLSQQLNSEIIVYLKLHACAPVFGGLTIRHRDSVESYLNFGWKAGDFCRDLLEQADQDPLINQQTRERARQMLDCVLRSNLPKDHVAMACQGIIAVFLWLVLHDPTDGELLRINMLRAIQQFGRAVVTITSSRKRAYVITVGDAVSDVADALFKAEEMGVTVH